MSSSASAFSLRAVGPEAAELLSAIHQECFPTYWDISSFNDFFGIENTFALLAEAPVPVGMIIYRIQHEQADIITTAVLEGWRRKGIAHELLEKALDHASSKGAKSMFLDVEEGNKAAESLYLAHGFAHLNRRKNYYRQTDGTYTDALVMTRKLPVASGTLPV